MTLSQYVKDQYIGRVLIGSEFGMNQSGCQTVTVPQMVIGALITTTGDHDPCVLLTLENGERAYFYDNEEIYFQDDESKA